MSETFDAMVITDAGERKTKAEVTALSLADLPDYPVLVEISHSTVNFKDGLAITGKGRIARRLPMIAGIDLAGTVVESASPDWKPGDKVICNGWGLSETEQGAYAKYQRLKPEWLLPLPEAFTPEQAMAIGTAGYTAALCVQALLDWGKISKEGPDVLVTGAAGGVGSVAIALLGSMGYPVTAVTGRPETHEYLSGLGAKSFLDRAEIAEAGKPLQAERWAGAVDVVGSHTLANVLAQTCYGGAVAACGLAGGADLPATVMPHILRGVALLGVDSVMAPMEKRKAAWKLLADHLDPALLSSVYSVHPFAELPQLAADIIGGKIRGRVVVEI
ncbi:oxidoreductase [Pseudooceanicola sp. CBS1P-1]|uniref:Acryloyl-CoA reductase n=1 Tax=Pseudooceanicola albus TaxID=2692189 RepID=A0A6L7FZ94_9RHOB|nr:MULTISPECIES: MDR family oxidoreductase [Pseudooceanicola]MBT9383957.1 oxidoreductase [Pseudooceanicola endophyticus]MXN16630.1 acryloyl-CoA reductase [Pseudooceanicola albus]